MLQVFFCMYISLMYVHIIIINVVCFRNNYIVDGNLSSCTPLSHTCDLSIKRENVPLWPEQKIGSQCLHIFNAGQGGTSRWLVPDKGCSCQLSNLLNCHRPCFSSAWADGPKTMTSNRTVTVIHKKLWENINHLHPMHNEQVINATGPCKLRPYEL